MTFAAFESVVFTATNEAIPAAPMNTPKIAQKILARLYDFGVNQIPQVMPAVQIPFAR